MPHGAVFVEAVARVAQEADGLQEVVGDDGHIDVQLEIARRARHTDGNVVAEHLAAHHRHRFALGRVDFARHNGRTRFVFGDFDFAQAAARPLASQRMSLAILFRLAASVFNAPEAATAASRPPKASNLFGALTNGRPDSSASLAAAISAYSGWLFKPVPTAVPPRRVRTNL